MRTDNQNPKSVTHLQLKPKDVTFLTSKKYFPIALSEVFGFAGAASMLFNILKTIPLQLDYCIEITIGSFLLACIFLSFYRIWNAQENTFQFLESDHGEAADSPVKTAKHSIKTTHFTGIVPYDPYISFMKHKAENIKVKRIVCRDNSKKPEDYEWLKEFAECPYYEQIDIQEMFPLPLDIMIFDSKSVVLHLPADVDGDDFHSAIMIENEMVAHLFENLFARIEIRAKFQKKQNDRLDSNKTFNQAVETSTSLDLRPATSEKNI